MREHMPHHGGALAPFLHKDIHLRTPDLHERKLRGHEETVERDEQQDRADSQHDRATGLPFAGQQADIGEKRRNGEKVSHRKRNEPQAIGLRLVKRSAERSYQLDLVTPGIRPLEAISRKAIREILKRPMKARLRPVALQRRLRRTGLALRGSIERPM